MEVQSYACGIGLRPIHYPEILGKRPKVDWFEATSENYMDTGGRPLKVLEQVREHYPVGLHGVAMSIGSVDPLNLDYLKRLKILIQKIDPFIVSDHLCWSGAGGTHLHDLLPLPLTQESLRHLVSRIREIQDFLGRQILVENVSTYVTFKHSVIPEWEFVAEAAKQSGCLLLLDINNVYVNAKNHGFSARTYLENIPSELVGQIHLAGHTDKGKFLFDTHSRPVIEEVWDLYRSALERWGRKPTLIEWDEDIPPFERLMEEARKAQRIFEQAERRQGLSSGTSGSSAPAASDRTQGCTYDYFSRSGIFFGVRTSLGVPNNVRGDRLRSRHSDRPSARPSSECLRELPTDSPRRLSLQEIELHLRNVIERGNKDSENEEWLEQVLNPQGGESPAVRMNVYQEGYVARTRETLLEVYPAVARVLGEEVFTAAAEAYARAYPSLHYNLNLKGEHFAAYLQFLGSDPSSGVRPHSLAALVEKLPFLADLARLEWAVASAFHASREPDLDPSVFSGIVPEDWGKIRLIFQPSVHLLESAWPVLDIWKARTEPVDRIKIDLQNRAQKILVARRPSGEVFCELVSPLQYRFLQELESGLSLEEALEKMEEEPLDSGFVGTWFAHWSQTGLFTCGERILLSDA